MDFVERFNELLGNKRGSIARLSEAIGASSGVISAWKTGEKKPTLDYIVAIAKYFSVTTDYLLGLSFAAEKEKKTAPEISGNGLELLKYFEQLPEREQLLLIGEARGLLLAAEGKEASSSHPAPSGAKAV